MPAFSWAPGTGSRQSEFSWNGQRLSKRTPPEIWESFLLLAQGIASLVWIPPHNFFGVRGQAGWIWFPTGVPCSFDVASRSHFPFRVSFREMPSKTWISLLKDSSCLHIRMNNTGSWIFFEVIRSFFTIISVAGTSVISLSTFSPPLLQIFQIVTHPSPILSPMHSKILGNGVQDGPAGFLRHLEIIAADPFGNLKLPASLENVFISAANQGSVTNSFIK